MLRIGSLVHRGTAAGALFLSMASPLACGGDSESQTSGSTTTSAGGGGDGGTGGATGTGGQGGTGGQAFSPGPHGAAPQIITLGGPVLANPRVKAIYFADDPATNAQIDAFLAKLGPSSYWQAAGTDYGVGPLAVEPSVTRPDKAPATLDDAAVLAELDTQLGGAAPAWGPASADTIYMVVIPNATTFDGGGFCCQDYDGYHDETSVGGTKIAYSIICQCPGFDGPDVSDMDQITEVIGHELVEAATDPLVETNVAYGYTDDDHFVWTAITDGEVADLCEYELNVLTHPEDLSSGVPRVWSNSAAAAGHDPCVPAPQQPYFNSVPVLNDSVVESYYGDLINTKGVTIPAGGTATIDVQLFSDAPTDGPWTVAAYDDSVTGDTNLNFTWDKTTGQNGDTLKLTIKVVKANAGKQGEPFYLESKHGTTSHLWAGLVAN